MDLTKRIGYLQFLYWTKTFLRWKLGRLQHCCQLYRKVQRSNQLYFAGWRVESIRFEDQIFFYINDS